MEGRGWRGFKYGGNKKQAGGRQKPSGMLETIIGGPQRTVVLEEEEEEENENERTKKKKGCDVVWSHGHLPSLSDVRSSLL